MNKYILIIGFAGIISWIAWILVVKNLEPCITYDYYMFCKNTSKPAMILFFTSLFFALVSTFAIASYCLRLFFNKNEVLLDHINTALRQGTLLALLTLTAMGMLAIGILTWWSGILLIAAFSLLEFYIASALSP